MSFLEDLFTKVGISGLIVLFVTLYLLKWTLNLLRDPLSSIPGPFLARFTRLWLLRQYTQGDFHKTNVKLHIQYGMISPVITEISDRIRPNRTYCSKSIQYRQP